MRSLPFRRYLAACKALSHVTFFVDREKRSEALRHRLIESCESARDYRDGIRAYETRTGGRILIGESDTMRLPDPKEIRAFEKLLSSIGHVNEVLGSGWPWIQGLPFPSEPEQFRKTLDRISGTAEIQRDIARGLLTQWNIGPLKFPKQVSQSLRLGVDTALAVELSVIFGRFTEKEAVGKLPLFATEEIRELPIGARIASISGGRPCWQQVAAFVEAAGLDARYRRRRQPYWRLLQDRRRQLLKRHPQVTLDIWRSPPAA